jgi:hypothetical protein
VRGEVLARDEDHDWARRMAVLVGGTVETQLWTAVSAFHRIPDARDRVTSLSACPANRGLNLPYGLVDLTLGLQFFVGCHRADHLLDFALRLIDLPVALVPCSTCEASRHGFMTPNPPALRHRAATAQQSDA